MKPIRLLLPVMATVFWLARPSAMAQTQKDIEVVPANPDASVQLDIRINQNTVAIGDTVEFDFQSSADGYVSLWDIGTSGRVTRIFPNDLGGDPRVRAKTRYGAGGANDSFAFQVNGPTGMEDVYLVWTRTPEAQPTQFKYENAGVLAKDLAVVQRLNETDWATKKVTFEITEDGRPSVARPARPAATADTGSSQVYILAIGANVDPLTKTNADARSFATSFQQLFEIPARQVRVLENAYKRDFEAGMDWLRTEARRGDLVLIFFSGHGSTVQDDNGDEADGLDEGFVMYDAQGVTPLAEHMVRDDQFAAWVNQLPTDRVITFIDACHSGGLRKSLTNARIKFFVGGELGKQPHSGGWQQKARRLMRKDLAGGVDGSQGLTGTQSAVKGLVYAAAQEAEYALEGANGGLFITRLLEQLGQASNTNLAELFAETQRLVPEDSRGQQNPIAVGDTVLGQQLKLSTSTAR